MFLACGVAAFYAATFHLMTHAFMKGLLFLAAGNVVHMMNGTTNMEKMGGLWSKFKVTHVLFFVGVLAMSGIPPLAAFFSKDLILEEEYLAGANILFYMGLFVSILTAFYLMRAYCLTFWGETHIDNKILKVVKEAPYIMLVPVSILAVLAATGGFLGFSFGHPPPLERFLAHADITFASSSLNDGFHLTAETWMSIIGAFVGVLSAAYIYVMGVLSQKRPVELLKNGFYVDWIYNRFIVRPLESVARWIVSFWEPTVFEGSIRGVARIAQSGAGELQKMQSGQIRSYIAWMTIGAVLSIFYIIY
jgi:NADH-quinone oxidoreductase subunit L